MDLGRITVLFAAIAAGCGRDAADVDAAVDGPAIDAGDDGPDLDAVANDAIAFDAAVPPGDGADADAGAAIDSGIDGPPVVSWDVPCAGAVIARDVFTSKSDFSPEQLAIHVGEVVRFQPQNPHDVRAGTLAVPETWFFIGSNAVGCVRFDQPGVFDFYCNAHPFSMTGTVTVTP